MDLKGRWLWFMLTLVKVISSQQHCPQHCLQCDLNTHEMRCLKCVDGYYGVHCNMPCDPVCRNRKCRIDGSCHVVWKLRRMRRNTGVNCHDAGCTCCKPNYRGSDCQVHCPNCRTRYESGVCNRYCEPGFHGATCEEKCPGNCAPGNAGKPLCKQDTGECSNNCKPGSWGGICNKTCPTGCKEKICLPRSGSCVSCSGKYYGSTCEKKCHGCNESCHRNGTCVQGCADGYHGTLCNRRCGTDCSEGGRCRLYTKTKQVICSTECQYVPASDDVTEDCVSVTSPVPNTSNDGSIVVKVVVPVIVFLVIAFLVIAAVVIICLWRKKRGCWRSNTKKGSSFSENDEEDPLRRTVTGDRTELEIPIGIVAQRRTALEKSTE